MSTMNNDEVLPRGLGPNSRLPTEVIAPYQRWWSGRGFPMLDWGLPFQFSFSMAIMRTYKKLV